MMKILNKLKWYVKQVRNSCVWSWYYFCLTYLKIENKNILLQSRYGDDLGGNIFYILKELSENYEDYKLYLAYKKDNKNFYKKLLNNYNIKNVHLIEIHKIKYWYLLATCKFLVNDVTFHTAFIKREEQIYLNTWHGTPLKKMGIDVVNDAHLFGNIQRNILASDYFLTPNEYMKKIMISSNSLRNLFSGNFLEEGYPRNAVFFDKNRSNYIKSEMGISDKHVIVYMPTWRGNSSNNKSKEYVEKLKIYLTQIDQKLDDNMVFYIKLHPLVNASISFDEYSHIKNFPDKYEIYDFLTISDTLVTDYSSIMFDYACTGKNIVLFTYDFKEYAEDRGLYIDFKELPFYQAKTVDELISLLKSNVDYSNNEFIKNITKNENINSTKNICKFLLKKEACCSISNCEDNKKNNVYLFVDNLLKNGITSSAFNLINTIDVSKRNYFFVFRKNGTAPNVEKIQDIPTGVGILSLDTVERTLLELFSNFLYYKMNLSNKIIKFYVERCYKRNFKKYYGNVKQDYFIQFTGYSRDALHLFLYGKKKFIFVHSDMKKEIATKNQHKKTFIECYRKYDKVIAVSEEALKVAREIAEGVGVYTVIRNAFDYRNVIKKSLKDIKVQKSTEITTSNLNGLNGMINSKNKKFITIGRFSKEKEHIKLLEAFNKYWQKHRDTNMIIIGGYGSMYNETVIFAKKLPCWENICIIKSIDNPLNILKKCDLFILSSNYEAQPVVFLEAAALNIPILSTNIKAADEFFSKYSNSGGLLVGESVEDLYLGMEAFYDGKIKPLDINLEKYNEKCISDFESLFKN